MESYWVGTFIGIVILVLPSVIILAIRDKYILKKKIFPFIPHISIPLNEIKSDIQYCLYRAQYIATHASQKNTAIFFLLLLFIIGLAIFYSIDTATFYLNVAKILFISSISFIIFCIADSLWFLFIKDVAYVSTIQSKTSINSHLKKNIPLHTEINSANAEVILYAITNHHTFNYMMDVKRYLIEILVLLLILLFTFPLFALFNFALLWIFLYVDSNNNDAISEADYEIRLVVLCIDTLHRANPKRCKEFINTNQHPGITQLTMLYNSITTKSTRQK